MEEVAGLVINDVIPGSLAAEMEIEPGDTIVRINSQPVCDLIDFRFLVNDDYLEVDVIKHSGEVWQLEIEKEPEEDFGVQFASVSANGIKRCQNRCIFCFVDQMPPNLRKTLYEKDDDYRLSLTQGSFVTLTNLSEKDFSRIIRLHLSPLYISVHATDPEIRLRLLKNPNSVNILSQLQMLAAAGIIMHTQVVLVPNINDGNVLNKTIEDLAGLWPQVQSMAVVPVGLTTYREHLPSLNIFSKQHAREVIELGRAWQEKFQRDFGTTFLYFSDEFYVQAELDFPKAEHYGDFPQLENGVGLSRMFIDEVDKCLPDLPQKIAPRRVIVVTGVSAAKIIRKILDNVMQRVSGLQVDLRILNNRFFGPSVTVAGLLTGKDLLEGLGNVEMETILIPQVMLKEGEDIFLDDLSLYEVAGRLHAQIIAVSLNGRDFMEKLLGIKL